MARRIRRWFGLAQVVLVWCLLCTANASAQLALHRLPAETDLATKVSLLEDPEGRLGLADVRARDAEFVPHRRSMVALGFSTSALWLRFGAHNVSDLPVRWLVELGEPSLDHVQLYAVHRDGSLEVHEGGDAAPFTQRAIPHARTVFELNAPAHDNLTYYLRVQSNDVMRVPLHAYTPHAYAAHHERLSALQWLFYGVLLVMAAYNAAVFVLVRRVEYMRYACVAVALCLVLMCLNGHQSQFLCPSLPAVAARLVPLSMAIATLFVLLFMYDVLERLPILQDKRGVFEALTWAAVGLVVFCAFGRVGLALRVLAAVLLAATMVGPVILVRLARYQVPELRLYRRSWYGLVVGIPIAVLSYADVLPCWPVFDWALTLGFAAHCVMISLALPSWARGMEGKLAALNLQLTDNVNDLQHALARAEEANENALRATKAKDEFVATMSHELRTPLNAIINIPQGLINQFASVRSAKCEHCKSNYILEEQETIGPDTVCETCQQRGTLTEGTTAKYRGDDGRCLHFLQKIERSGQHLLQMVNGVLDYSKLEAGRFELAIASVDLELVIREVCEQMVDLAQRKNIQLEVSVEATIKRPLMGDVLRLKQALINLIANAIKFSEPETKVSVRWRSTADGELIEVEDRGIGIAPADQARIFESFEQVHKGDTRKYGGTGLGLSISRSLVRMHGGELSVHSELGKGSTFAIRLPRMRAALHTRPSGELRARPDNSNIEVRDSRAPKTG